MRLAVSLILLTASGSGMYAAIVSLQPIAAEFGLSRAAASMPYFMTMIGFGLGGVVMGRLSDRIGVMKPTLIGGLCLGLGYIGAAYATSLWMFTLIHGVLIGFLGMSPFMAPLVADISHWFKRRRGLAVGIVISGSYVAGTIWPPVIQHYVDTIGWRAAYSALAVVCFVTVAACAPLLYRRHDGAASDGAAGDPVNIRCSTRCAMPGAPARPAASSAVPSSTRIAVATSGARASTWTQICFRSSGRSNSAFINRASSSESQVSVDNLSKSVISLRSKRRV